METSDQTRGRVERCRKAARGPGSLTKRTLNPWLPSPRPTAAEDVSASCASSRALCSGILLNFARFLVTRASRLLHRGSAPGPCQRFNPQRVGSFHDYQERQQVMAAEFRNRSAVEREFALSGEVISTPGFCCVCSRAVIFHSDLAYSSAGPDGTPIPNWRERVVCPVCHLNNRMRAAIHFFKLFCRPTADSTLYLTEQTTPLFAWFKEHFRNTLGSEYLGSSVPAGWCTPDGVRNESLTGLSFPAASFDFILSFDVFEHIPDYRAAFKECLRCLKPGGALVFSVPFNLGSEQDIIRAEVTRDGTVVHRLPPEYHGDPLNTAGCLCFRHFGWSLLEDLHRLGYRDAGAFLYWSSELGYLGGDQVLFMATKQAPCREDGFLK